MIFNSINQHAPGKIALQDEQQTVYYRDLEAEIADRAKQLSQVSTLAIALDNSVDWVLWDLAALSVGVVCVPIPPFFSPEQRDHTLSQAAVSHIISPDGLVATGIQHTVALPETTAKVTFTSGTTGQPKGVCLPQRAMENVARSIGQVLGQDFVGTHLCSLPLAVLLENVAGVYAALIAGCTIRLPSLTAFGQNYDCLHQQVVETAATSIILVPEVLRILLAQVAQQGPLSSLKFIAVGGSKTDANLIRMARQMGLPVYEGYGLSECASVVSLNTPDDDRPGSVGKLLPHVAASVEAGEIRIHNPGFLGYIGQSTTGSFNTEDLGALDADGFLSITGRKKNVLITSYGRNISPEWVEASLLCQPEIAQTVVYGDAQPHLSALIVPVSANADIQQVILKANAGLPEYAQIRDYSLAEPFTLANGLLTGTGRPRRAKILERLNQL
ncbi:AMP-binding protein [Amphritea pacifica]|uniref:AMP-binding protein n=1 Tax=Amphritea pacifica TaxID=2811233 RepID=UPI001965088B|nr:AMP-binding protein [Amphritea pacifica]MBN1008487.1 AMP-binding protein [Amphritea pacifica]